MMVPHAIAWAAITTSVRKVFSGPPLKAWRCRPRFFFVECLILNYRCDENKIILTRIILCYSMER